MEITIQKVNQSVITLEFLQDLEEGVDDITPLVNSLKKIKKIINVPGYGNKFTKAEKELWNKIIEDLVEEEKVKGIGNNGINMIPT